MGCTAHEREDKKVCVYLGQVFFGLGVELQRRRRAKAVGRIECGARADLQLLRGLAHEWQSLVEGLACRCGWVGEWDGGRENKGVVSAVWAAAVEVCTHGLEESVAGLM